VGTRVGLETEATGKILLPLPGIEPRSPSRPVCSQTLYWLSYPAHAILCYSGMFDTDDVSEVDSGGLTVLLTPD
jgi:hypothetical protein